MSAPGPSLEGKVAIVTGGGIGMGEATAILFAEHGARVVVSDINEEAGEGTVESIRSTGGTAAFIAANVAEEDQVEALVARTIELYGKLDCAVNNAAIAPDTRPVAEADLQEFDRVIAVNLRSVLICMKHEIRRMLEDGGGAIVNVGSVSSVRPQPNNPAYTAAKHGVIGLTKAASLEVAGKGIRVNAVLPGAIDTPMLRAALVENDFTEEEFAPALSLMGRFGRPEEVGHASLWLCSDCASFVTGHALAVEAGYLSR